MPNLQLSLSYLVPELILGGTAVIIFLVAAVHKPSMKTLYPILAIAGIIAAGIALLIKGAPNQGLQLFAGMIATDPFSVFFKALALITVLITVFLSMGSQSLPENRGGEYHGQLLVLTFGLCLLMSANHLLMIYIALETVSLCSYLLTGWDENRQRSREAGLKYVLFGGVASGIMVFGMSLLYGLTGELTLGGIHQSISQGAVSGGLLGYFSLLTSLVFVLAGLGYKVAAVPFHMWCPDVYEGAPTPVTALLSVAPKAAGFAILLRFFYGIFLEKGTMETTIFIGDKVPWVLVIGLISAITMTVGNFAAIVQNNVKRLLAYSSIAHAGYLLMGIAAGGGPGFEAVSLYLAVYLLMNLGAFAIVSTVARKYGSEDIDAFRNLGKLMPAAGVFMAIFLVSLTGLPPSAGFIGKMYLFLALLKEGGFWLVVLAIIAVLNSVVSLYYYARILKAMYFELPQQRHRENRAAKIYPAMSVAAVMAVFTLLLGIFWSPLAEAVKWSAVIFH